MTPQRMTGIDGILDNLLSTSHAHRESNANNEAVPTECRSVPASAESGSSPGTGARRGRPLGQRRREGGPKEKVTFRISCELATTYRNWSWEARCSLSSLVESALREYHCRQAKRTASQQPDLLPPEKVQNNV